MQRRDFLRACRSSVRSPRRWPRPALAPPSRPLARSSSPAATTARRSSATWRSSPARSGPKLLYLPTASADSPSGIITWFRELRAARRRAARAGELHRQHAQTQSWEEVLLSVDGIVASGGNTLNQQAIWKAQGIDVVLRQGVGPRHRARRRERGLALLVRGRHDRLAAEGADDRASASASSKAAIARTTIASRSAGRCTRS